jgi:alpha-glucosidase
MSAPGTTAPRVGAPWWQTAVVYQIYPRSFCDSNGDGVGDLPGITSKLEYVAALGVDALWISPFFKSPMHDFGYDVSDYCAVDPLFGTLGDFDALVQRAHVLGLRVLIDWVPSHTSNEHAWFRAALADRDAPERDFYVFADPAPSGAAPNGWLAAFPQGASAWTRDPASGQYYLHSFLPEQPDLNWHDDTLAARMLDVLRFWLDRGVDGFRIDVAHNLAKDLTLSELPAGWSGLPCMLLNDRPLTHARLREVRALLDSYPGERVAVGEIFLLETEKVAGYYGQDDELHLCFDFLPLYTPWSAEAWRAQLERSARALDPIGAWPTCVLSNHDQKRVRTRLDGSEAAARAALVLLLTLRGTPFLYMGEELGLEDAQVSQAQRVDPGGRDGCRAPLPWTRDPPHGWNTAPWLPAPPEAGARSVQAQESDPRSMLQLCRRLVATRKASAALSRGAMTLLAAPPGVLAFERSTGDERYEVWINFGTEPVRGLEAPSGEPAARQERTVVVASDGIGTGTRFCGELESQRAVVVRVTDAGGEQSAR